MHDDILRIVEGNILMYGFIIDEINVLNREKIFKAYYGFRVLYIFPFSSAGH